MAKQFFERIITMSKYILPEQIIDDIVANLNNTILSAFDKYTDKYQLGELQDYIRDIIKDKYNNNIISPNFHDDAVRMNKTRRKMHSRTLQKYTKLIEELGTDNEDPIFAIYAKGLFSLEDINTKDDLLKLIKDWHTTSSLMTTFPFMSYLNKTQFLRFLNQDTAIDIFRIANECYDGSFSNFFKYNIYNPEEYVTFSISNYRKTNQLREYSTKTHNVKVVTENNKTLTIAHQKALEASLHFIGKEFYTDNIVRVSPYELAKRVYGPHPGADKIKKTITLMFELSKAYVHSTDIETGEDAGVMHFFDIALNTNASKNEPMIIRYSSNIRDQIIDNKLIATSSKKDMQLESPTSKLLHSVLQGERIKHTVKRGEAIPPAEYTLAFFMSKIYFGNMKKREIIDEIANSLNEFMKKKIVIKNFKAPSTISGNFRIEFIPLSESEYNDFYFSENEILINIIDV